VTGTPLSKNKFLLVFIAWWITWAGIQTWVLYWLGFSFWLSATDSVVTNILLSGACVLISNNLQYYLPQRQKYGYILLLSLILSGGWLLAVKYLLPLLVTNENNYSEFLSKSLPVRFTIAFLLIACMATVSVLWYTFEEQKAGEKQKADAEQLAKEAELYKLRQQLQPHFLFNSLNSINALIGLRPQEARKMVQQLSEFLRGTLKREEHQWIPLREELQHLQLYLEIEKVRFGNRLSTAFTTDEDSLQMKIPAMLLQPIVENAIKFGLYDTIGETTVQVIATGKQNELCITVINPFDPETALPGRGTGFGLSSVKRRLYLLFARNDLVETRTEGNLFTTYLKIPQTA
jgi:hypothetical protein